MASGQEVRVPRLYIVNAITATILMVMLLPWDELGKSSMGLIRLWPAFAMSILFVPVSLLTRRYLCRGLHSNGNLAPFGIGIFITALQAIVCLEVFDGIPHITDAIVYFWQSKAISTGHLLYSKPPDLPEFFYTNFILSGDKWYSLFPVGYPLLLSLGQLIHAPYIIDPLMCAGSTVFVYFIIKDHLLVPTIDPLMALLAALSVGISPFFTVHASSFMSHTTVVFMSLLSLLLLFKWQETKSLRFLAGSILSAGYIFITRPLDGLVLAVPIMVYVLVEVIRTMPWPKSVFVLLLACLLYVPFPAFQLAQNNILTGSMWMDPHTQYFNQTESEKDCFRLAIPSDETFVGCKREHGMDPKKPYTMGKAYYLTVRRLHSFSYWLLRVPFAPLIAAVLFLLPLGIVRLRNSYLLAGIFLSNTLLYVLYYQDCDVIGARFLFISFPPIAMLVCAAIVGIHRLLSSSKRQILRASSYLLLGLIASFPINGIRYILSDISNEYPKGFWEVGPTFIEGLKNMDIHNSVVLVPGTVIDYRLVFFMNDAEPNSSDVIFVRDFGENHNKQLYRYFEGRKFYRLIYRSNALSTYTQLAKEELKYSPRVVYLEAESKWPLYVSVGGKAKETEEYKLTRGKLQIHPGTYLSFQLEEAKGYYSFRQYLFDTSKYNVRVCARRNQLLQQAKLQIDGVEIMPEIFGKGNYSLVRCDQSNLATISLEKGMHEIGFIVEGHPKKHGKSIFELDWMMFEKI